MNKRHGKVVLYHENGKKKEKETSRIIIKIGSGLSITRMEI